MKIRALKTTHGSYGMLPRGEIANVPDWEAKEMIVLGYAIEELPIEKKAAAPQNVKLEAGDKDPFTDAPTGGQTGEARQPSLSRRGRQRRNAQ